MASSVFLQLDPDAFFATDAALDYTFVAVRDPGNATAAYGWNPLIEAEGKLTTDEYVSIIQHPEGQPKQLALRENRVVGILEQHVLYTTDTAPGSSGSPVFNDQWEVVALHHSGVPRKNAAGQWLARDGRVWTAAMGEQQIDWIANEGVRISRIIAHVQGTHLTGMNEAQRGLWTACFEVPRRERREDSRISPPVPPGVPPTLVPAGDAPSPRGGGGAPMVAPDGSVTWQIPLQVSVRLGMPQPCLPSLAPPSGVTPVARPSGGTPPTPAHPGPDHVGTVPAGTASTAGSADRTHALKTLKEARQRKYYDAKADRVARDTYYEGRALPNDAEEAYRWLAELVRSTHRETPRYRPMVEVYPWVDLHPNGMLRSIYSGLEYEPADFIEADERVRQERAAIVERPARESARAAGTDEGASLFEALEAALPYNCEHVVPQSWFGKEEPMRGDLHHLFACESGCNSFRGNTPYYDFSEEEEKTRDACGRREANKFEPVDGKGVVARATLYFLLRYPGAINDAPQEFEAGRLDMLREWCGTHPVTDYERHRNAAIQERQGNRNPFIDFPDWAAGVDFTQGLGA